MPRLSFPVMVGLAALAGALAARPSLVPRGVAELERSWRLLRSTAHSAGIDADPFLVGQPDGAANQLEYTPNQPVAATRPDSWPGGSQAPLANPQAGAPQYAAPTEAAPSAVPVTTAAPTAPTTNPIPFPGQLPVQTLEQENQPLAKLQAVEGAEVFARVGPEVILAADVMPTVDALIKAGLEQSKQEYPKEVIEQQRKMLAQQFVNQLILQKMVYADCRRTLPEKALPKIDEQLRKNFEEKELPKMLKQQQVNSRTELEQKLRAQGTSIERLRRASMERNMVGQWMHEKTHDDREINYLDLVDYYEKNHESFHVEAKARWQQITITFAKHPAKADAWRTLAAIGQQLQQGASFEALAKQHSEGLTADKGGQRDWTTKGSLVSTTLDEAIFHLPVGALSQILEDRDGFHIVRVQERTEEGYTPFSQAQDAAREAIKKSRENEKRDQFLVELKKKYPVTTIFDEQPAAGEVSQRPAETLR